MASGQTSFVDWISRPPWIYILALNVAKSLGDLSPLKSVGLHKLKGDRRGQWAMTVNDRWRICFEFRKGDAHEVEIVDYHRG
jgi:proteic killer suppression protein